MSCFVAAQQAQLGWSNICTLEPAHSAAACGAVSSHCLVLRMPLATSCHCYYKQLTIVFARMQSDVHKLQNNRSQAVCMCFSFPFSFLFLRQENPVMKSSCLLECVCNVSVLLKTSSQIYILVLLETSSHI